LGTRERAPRPRVLSIAGSDSGGGAGIQADLKTFSALGCYGMTAITAVTAQNTKGVQDVEPLSPEIVGAQIRAVATDIGVDAAKTGMLASAPIVEAVVEAVVEARVPNLVVDPVLVSKHGQPLLDPGAVGILRSELLPLAILVTPNLREARELTGLRVETRDGMRRAAEAVLGTGVGAVLVKGGHLDGAMASDLFADGERELWLEEARIETPNTHGTGCTMSSAIAASLARGTELAQAVREAKAFVTQAIRRALALGEGVGPVDQLWGSPR
jgi:hydroxymethylpyrimidine/phosphomethylpyrimidine kinase